MHVDASRDLYFILFFPNEKRRGGGAGGCALPDFFFPCSVEHERDWPPCKVVFFGLATNTLTGEITTTTTAGKVLEHLESFFP